MQGLFISLQVVQYDLNVAPIVFPRKRCQRFGNIKYVERKGLEDVAAA
jgi:hypothetical protein